MALIFTVASLFIEMEDMVAAMDGLVNGMPFLIAMLENMTCTSAVSLSLEGKHLWIVKSLPLERKTLLQGKILFNIILVLPVSLVCSAIFIFRMKVRLIQALAYMVY